MRKKELFINAIRMIDIDGNVNIPTVLYYEPSESVLIGSEALAKAISSHEILNANFKIDIGLVDPKSTTPRRKFLTSAGTSESAARLTTDFIHQLLLHTKEWFKSNDITTPTNILLAEPLAMQIEKASLPAEWLPNYRKSLTAILSGEGFKAVDFLPEPFAVFQYYRYGLIQSLVSGVLSPTEAVERFYHAENCLYVQKHFRQKEANAIMSHGVQLRDLFEWLPAEEAQREFYHELETIRSLCLHLLEKPRSSSAAARTAA